MWFSQAIVSRHLPTNVLPVGIHVDDRRDELLRIDSDQYLAHDFGH